MHAWKSLSKGTLRQVITLDTTNCSISGPWLDYGMPALYGCNKGPHSIQIYWPVTYKFVFVA